MNSDSENTTLAAVMFLASQSTDEEIIRPRQLLSDDEDGSDVVDDGMTIIPCHSYIDNEASEDSESDIPIAELSARRKKIVRRPVICSDNENCDNESDDETIEAQPATLKRSRLAMLDSSIDDEVSEEKGLGIPMAKRQRRYSLDDEVTASYTDDDGGRMVIECDVIINTEHEDNVEDDDDDFLTSAFEPEDVLHFDQDLPTSAESQEHTLLEASEDIDTNAPPLMKLDLEKLINAPFNGVGPTKSEVTLPSPILPQKLPAGQTWDEIAADANAVRVRRTGESLSTFIGQKQDVLQLLHMLHKDMQECPGENQLAKEPYGLVSKLMRHQLHGLAWANWREQKYPSGGIIADDMGVGKTLLLIALVLQGKNRRETLRAMDTDNDEGTAYDGGTLVIAPATLTDQWAVQVKQHTAPYALTVHVHHGDRRLDSAQDLARFDMVITSYGTVKCADSSGTGAGILNEIKWRRIILDEAHVIRNRKTAQARACCQLKALHRWALTGTPVQNHEEDIQSLLAFLRCQPFDDVSTFRRWCDADYGSGSDRLALLLKPMLLRRTKLELQNKGELASIGTKEIEEISVKLTKYEMEVYSRIMGHSCMMFNEFLQQRTDKRYGGSMMRGRRRQNIVQQMAEDSESHTVIDQVFDKFRKLHQVGDELKATHIFVLILRLRQLCNHPSFILTMFDDSELDDLEGQDKQVMQDINGKIEIEDGSHEASARDKESRQIFQQETPSSKINTVLKILRRVLCSTFDKVVIVSQWTSMLTLIGRNLTAAHIKHVQLTGETTVKKRKDIVESFNTTNNERVLLLSLVAGGVGLNLTGANHLILMEPHWNPQLEAQAQDRVYRIGQKRPVRIYKLLCDNTIEMRIKALQDRKLKLSENVLTGSKNSAKLGIEEMKKLFEMPRMPERNEGSDENIYQNSDGDLHQDSDEKENVFEDSDEY